MNYDILVKAHKRGKRYRAWVKAVIARDKRCVICGREDGLGAHHLNSWAYFPKLRYNVDNGVTLCTKNDIIGNCHTLFHCDYKDSFRQVATEKDFREFQRIIQYMYKRVR